MKSSLPSGTAFLLLSLLWIFPHQSTALAAGSLICAELTGLSGSTADATPTILNCVDRTPDNGVLELPAGRYTIGSTLHLRKSILIRTQGLDERSPGCNLGEQRVCAELRAAPAFTPAEPVAGMVKVETPHLGLDHLVLDGNRAARTGTAGYRRCQAGDNAYGYNLVSVGSYFTMTNSVSENALCASALALVGPLEAVRLERNIVASNGVHNQQGLWADGITIHDLRNSAVLNNLLADNTDVDLIFGGCASCRIQGNRVVHSPHFEGSSFAAIMIHAWPTTSGNYTGTDFSGNEIDCGPMKRCGFGLLLGSEPWYPGKLFGGSYHDNRIRNAMQPVNVDRATGTVELFNNQVEFTVGNYPTSCGRRTTSAFNIYDSKVDMSRNRSSLPRITQESWKGCILNWWAQDHF